MPTRWSPWGTEQWTYLFAGHLWFLEKWGAMKKHSWLLIRQLRNKKNPCSPQHLISSHERTLATYHRSYLYIWDLAIQPHSCPFSIHCCLGFFLKDNHNFVPPPSSTDMKKTYLPPPPINWSHAIFMIPLLQNVNTHPPKNNEHHKCPIAALATTKWNT